MKDKENDTKIRGKEREANKKRRRDTGKDKRKQTDKRKEQEREWETRGVIEQQNDINLQAEAAEQ